MYIFLGDGREHDAEEGGMEMNNVFSFLSSGYRSEQGGRMEGRLCYNIKND
jgi:hypothetical protein